MTSLQVLRLAFCVTFGAVLLTGCEKNPEAKQLLKEIQADYEAGNYQRVIYCIDSMRHNYPDAIEERREALKFHQEASLKMAQLKQRRFYQTIANIMVWIKWNI